MSYTVLARKYRPQTFADLSGQEHVTRTLGNALTSGRVAHAFLFTGVRGVGKTTTARILAKALNCEKGPTPQPCSTCAACTEIAAGVDLDVLEIDGASNNSVEDVRRLQETIPFRPARDRFKIVIVDEVHMLSTGAFNAFLKTLEEPPPHMKFIFATTESHKVPITIRSRCQRYDFRLIPQAVVARRVREILALEGLEADDDAVSLVSRESAGSMRDALTLLDQIVAFSSGKLIGEEVAKGLGIADREALFAIATAMLDGDGASVLAAIDGLAQRGLDLLHFARALVDFLRDLVVLRISGEATDLVSLVEEERKRAHGLAKRMEPLELQRAFHAASTLIEEIGKSTQPKIALEMGLCRIATRPPLRAVSDVLARLEDLERRLGGGGGAGSSPGGGRGPARSEGSPGRATSGPATSSPATSSPATSSPATSSPATSSPANQTRLSPGASPAPDIVPSASDTRGLQAPHASSVAPPSEPTPVATAHVRTAPRDAPRNAPLDEPRSELRNVPPPEPLAAPEIGASPASEPATSARMTTWAAIVSALAETRPPIGAILQHAVPTELSSLRIVVEFPRGSVFVTQASSKDARTALADTAERALGTRPEIEVREAATDTSAHGTLAQLADERDHARYEATRKKALNHPLVLDALAVFDSTARHIDVRIEDTN